MVPREALPEQCGAERNGKTAARELAGSAITSLAQVAARSRKELLALHGVGPKAIAILGAALAAKGLRYRGS